jgi:tRNA threonylcarbamoyladenosine biosynthesis protein TsaB
LRVGVSAAKGLAQALGLGVVGVTSLEILTRGAADHGGLGLVLAVVDARRGEVFSALSTVGRGAELTDQGQPGLSTPDALCALLAELEGQPVLAVGDGAQRYADLLDAVPGVTALRHALGWPPPRTLLAMAEQRLAQGVTPVDPHSVVPLYMREADARSNFAQVGRA